VAELLQNMVLIMSMNGVLVPPPRAADGAAPAPDATYGGQQRWR